MRVAFKLFERARHAVRYFLLRRLPTCKRIAPLTSESLERPLGLGERAVLHLHLFVCVWCVWYRKQLQMVRSACLERGKEEAGEDVVLSEEARERIRRALREGAG